MPSEITVVQRGASTVPIRTTGHEKRRVTVFLAVKADGSKVKLFVVIHAKKVKAELAAIKGVVVRCSANGWMNDELTHEWVSQIWGTYLLIKYFWCGLIQMSHI